MPTPRMDQGSSKSVPLAGQQPGLQDRTNSQRVSTRDQGSGRDTQRSKGTSTTQTDTKSETSRYNNTRGPINDAVHSALNPIDPTHTTIPEDVIKQLESTITANILQHLQTNPTSPLSAHAPPANKHHMDPTSSSGTSPPTDREKVYTPPSPYRASEEAAQHESFTSPRKPSFPPPPEPRRPPSPPFSHATLSDDSDARDGGFATEGDTTILEKIWGPLFDKSGQPTTRLSQFLRGIAVHLIEDYEPKHSLVVSPDKMQKYYEETKLSNELYQWNVVFDDRTSSISRMYREIQAQHHLVQDRLDVRPDIPGLTPIGFEAWMTLVLKAYPDEEFDRLAYTALHMPVSNPDDRKERFPKELSRRQFPKESDTTLLSKLQKIVREHCDVQPSARTGSMSDRENKPHASSIKNSDIPLHAGSTSQRSSQPDYPLSQTTTRSSIPDMDRNALRATVSEVVDGTEDSPIEIVPPPQIERERKPYVAQPGGGKTHDKLDTPIIQPAETKASHLGASEPAKLTRSTSLNNGRPSDHKVRPSQPISIHQKPAQGPPPVDIPVMRPRAGSSYHRDTRRGDRNRSPSMSRRHEVPHKSDNEVSYGSYHVSSPPNNAPSSWRSDTRYDNRGSFSAESRDRDSRPRYHSVSSGDGHRYYPTNKDYPSDEEYYRSGPAAYSRPDSQFPQQACPPTSYRNRA